LAAGLLVPQQGEETHVVALVGGRLKPDPAGRVISVILVDGVYEYLLGVSRVCGAQRVVLEPREPVESVRAIRLRQQAVRQQKGEQGKTTQTSEEVFTSAKVYVRVQGAWDKARVEG